MSVSDEVAGLADWVNERGREIPLGIVDSVSAKFEESLGPDGLDCRLTITIEPFSEFAEVVAATARFTITSTVITRISVEGGDGTESLSDLPNDETGCSDLVAILREWVKTLCPSIHDYGER